MKINGQHYRTIRLNEDAYTVTVIDQTVLPFAFKLITISTADEAAEAIRFMRVRGAPLIGATAAYGLAMALKNDSSDQGLKQGYDLLLNTRPTAINLKWALDRMIRGVSPLNPETRAEQAYTIAAAICEEDVAINKAIGGYGLELIRQVAKAKGQVNILTHCNAGWLGTVDYGTALSPIYMAHDEGISVHVWVDETRPRNQGALTAWELQQHGVKHTYITDNAGGHVLQQGLADMVIVGTDRVAANGDVCNKIGTYLKALAAHDCGVPFYVAVPTPSIDWELKSGGDIPIEQRSSLEVTNVQGWQDGKLNSVRVTPDESTNVANYGFDVTPNRLITGLITEHGIFKTPAEIAASRAAA